MVFDCFRIAFFFLSRFYFIFYIELSQIFSASSSGDIRYDGPDLPFGRTDNYDENVKL